MSGQMLYLYEPALQIREMNLQLRTKLSAMENIKLQPKPSSLNLQYATEIDMEIDRAKRQQHNADSDFFRLPPEIRNMIYRHCIPKNQDVLPSKSRSEYFRIRWQRRCVLLQTCRAIRNETLPIYYGSSVFILSSRRATTRGQQGIKEWVEGLSPEALIALRRVRILVRTTCLRVLRPSAFNKVNRFIVDIDRDRESEAFTVQPIRIWDVRCCAACNSAHAMAVSVINKMKEHTTRGEQPIRKEYLTDIVKINECTAADFLSKRWLYVGFAS